MHIALKFALLYIVTESEPGCSRKKILRNNKNNTESDKVTEETEVVSKINSQSDSSVLDKVFKSPMKRNVNEGNEANKETTMFDESEIKTNENVILEFDKENKDPENQDLENQDPESQDEMKENPEKKIKTENNKEICKLKTKKNITKRTHVKRCEYCQQKLNEIKVYQGHPNGALEEQIALIDPKLCLFMGDESFIDENDERPQNKLTHFR